MFIPYRAKNPPEHFPWATVSLIAVNVIVFLATSEMGLLVREDAVRGYALIHTDFWSYRQITALFLHNDLLHLAGNMLFLWILGGPLEGRLRVPLYLVLYLFSGLAGSVAHDLFLGTMHPTQYSLGASGAVMGVAGAYLWVFPFSTICAVYAWYYRFGVTEWQARWVVLMYIGLDVFGAILIQSADGVGHLAHLGGFGLGLFAVIALRTRRDSVEASEAQALQADVRDYTMLSYPQLAALMERGTEDPELVLAYCKRALDYSGGARAGECAAAVGQYRDLLLTQGDPTSLATLLLRLPQVEDVRPVYYLRVASRLERISSNDLAYKLYTRLTELYPASQEAPAALMRMAHVAERAYGDRRTAYQVYGIVMQRYPRSEQALEAQDEQRRLGAAARGRV